jgi:hypothetical protein
VVLALFRRQLGRGREIREEAAEVRNQSRDLGGRIAQSLPELVAGNDAGDVFNGFDKWDIRASAMASAQRRVLPMPASPVRRMSAPWPRAAASRYSRRTAVSWSRPTNGVGVFHVSSREGVEDWRELADWGGIVRPPRPSGARRDEQAGPGRIRLARTSETLTSVSYAQRWICQGISQSESPATPSRA